MLALSAAVIASVVAAGLAAPARAEVSGVSVTIPETSLVVTGIESDPATCGLVIVEVADQPGGAVYPRVEIQRRFVLVDGVLGPVAGHHLRREGRGQNNYCTPFAVPDAAFRQLDTWIGGAPAGTTGNAAITELAVPRPADRFGYCSVAGNTHPDGPAVAAGTFLNLVLGQPGFDPHYTAAFPSFYIEGVGSPAARGKGWRAYRGAPLGADAGGNLTPDGFDVYVPRV
jgi:hypothetical protein